MCILPNRHLREPVPPSVLAVLTFDEPFGPPLDRLVVRAGRAVQRATERAAADGGIGATAMRILRVVADDVAISQRDLAAAVGVTPATLTPMMDRLEALGALTRERACDRRVVFATITPLGREMLDVAQVAVALDVRERLPPVGPEAAAALREFLLTVIATFDDGPGLDAECGG